MLPRSGMSRKELRAKRFSHTTQWRCFTVEYFFQEHETRSEAVTFVGGKGSGGESNMSSERNSQPSLTALQQMSGLCSIFGEGKQHFMVEGALRHLILHCTANDGQGNCCYTRQKPCPHIALLSGSVAEWGEGHKLARRIAEQLGRFMQFEQKRFHKMAALLLPSVLLF